MCVCVINNSASTDFGFSLLQIVIATKLSPQALLNLDDALSEMRALTLRKQIDLITLPSPFFIVSDLLP